MTSLHQKHSAKVAIATTKEDDGGVAACLNWSYGRSRKPKPESAVNEEAIRFQEAVDRVINNLSKDKENEPLNIYSPEPPEEPWRDGVYRPVLSPRDNLSRVDQRTPTPADLELLKPERTWSRAGKSQEYGEKPVYKNGRRAPTPGAKCNHTHPNRRMEAWVSQADEQEHSRQHDDQNNNKKVPLDATKKFLKKYFNRPLNDDELRRVLKETHKRISDDIVTSTIEERGAERPSRGHYGPTVAKSCTLHNRNSCVKHQSGPVRAMALPHKEQQLQLVPRGQPERQRPVSAQYTSRDNRVRWDQGVRSRPSSATLPARSDYRELTERGTHFTNWRPNNSMPHQPWTQSANNYDDLWQMKGMRSKRHTAPKQLGASRYRTDHMDAERDYLQVRPASQQGKVNLQLDCPENTDMTVSVRVQKSRASTRY